MGLLRLPSLTFLLFFDSSLCWPPRVGSFSTHSRATEGSEVKGTFRYPYGVPPPGAGQGRVGSEGKGVHTTNGQRELGIEWHLNIP